MRLTENSSLQPPIENCPEDGPTICLDDENAKLSSMVDQARTAFRNGKPSRGRAFLDQAEGIYDFRRLYNQLVVLKKSHPTEREVKITAASETPVQFVIRVILEAKSRLPKDRYETDGAHRKARKGALDDAPPLFDMPILSIAI